MPIVPSPKRPKTEVQDGFTRVDVTVNLHHGLCLRPSGALVMKCRDWDRAVYLVKESPRQEDGSRPLRKVDAKSIMEVMTLGATKGVRLTIMVEGKDDEARRLARQLHSALSSSDSYAPGLDEFDM